MGRVTLTLAVTVTLVSLLYVNCDDNVGNMKDDLKTFRGSKRWQQKDLRIKADDIFQSESGLQDVEGLFQGRHQIRRQLRELSKEPFSRVQKKARKGVQRSVKELKKRQSETTSSEERSRILVAPHWLPDQRQFRQLNIDNGVERNYRFLNLKYVISFVYVSRQRKLLISLYKPDRIVSADLDEYGVYNITGNVRANDMCVDEGRDTVFFTTSQPDYTISSMNTQGEQLSVIQEYSRYGNYPRAIAVNPAANTLYVSDDRTVYAVSYDGQVRQALASGNLLYALSFDNTGNNLYYNNDRKVMKLSLSSNVPSEVTSLDVIPWNFRLYDNTLYFSSFGAFNGTIGSVNLEDNSVNSLLSVNMDRARNFLICLVP